MSGRHSSNIWNFYQIKSSDEKTATCKMCQNVLSYKSTSNNLRKHMQRKHPLVDPISENHGATEKKSLVMEVVSEDPDNEPKQGTSSIPREVSESQKAKTQTTVNAFLRKKMGVNARKSIDDNLMLLFTHDLQPFSMVEDYGFRKFVEALNPTYQLPSRKTITNSLLPVEFGEVYNRTKFVMSNVKAVTLTTDCWTSSNTENFLAVTAHFLTHDFVIKHMVLGCEAFGERHTGENLGNAIKKIIDEWELQNKILIVVSDNASNIKKAVKDILQLRHFGCYAHSINLIAHDSLVHAIEILDKIKKIVGYFRRSSFAMAKLLEQQKHLKIIPTKKLIQDVVTRWNSTYYMTERFVELEEPIRTTMALIRHDLPIISEEEWQFLKELIVILRPLEDVTRTMSGENYLTGSSVIILTDGLRNVYRELNKKNHFSTISKTIISSILDGINCRLGDLESSNSLTLTTFLDPRFKNIAFSNEYVGESVKRAAISLITKVLKNQTTNAEETKENEATNTETQEKSENSIWGSFDKKVANLKPTGSAQSRAIIEVQRYLEEPPINRKENPLNWWKNNSHNFPNLSSIVREKFIVVATSVPCERLFSKSGLILSDRRNRLGSEKVKQILFIGNNKD